LKCLNAVIETGGERVFGSKAVVGADKDGGGVLNEVAAEVFELRQLDAELYSSLLTA
jgi:hypothetical protein